MKMKSFTLAMLAGTLVLTSCGTTSTSNLLAGAANAMLNGQNQSQTQTPVEEDKTENAGFLSSLLGGLLGNSKQLTEKDVYGTWNYVSTDCVFESENFLAQAGGSIAATKIENTLNEHLVKVGIKEGNVSFTFNEDHTCLVKVGTRTIRGTYEVDAANKSMRMAFLGGLATINSRVVKKGQNISILMESSKLLVLVKTASALSNKTSMKLLTGALDKYEGLYLGLQLKK